MQTANEYKAIIKAYAKAHPEKYATKAVEMEAKRKALEVAEKAKQPKPVVAPAPKAPVAPPRHEKYGPRK